jgi:N-acylneuraminate cytidylyltransferase
MKLAVIPARGGSKRIPRKNIRLFRGLPMLAWSVRAALASKVFDEVMVSTDDDEIASVARAQGAAVPFMRSGEASGDHATTSDVLTEVLESYRARGAVFAEACCLYPTAPFTTAEDLKEGHRRLTESTFDVVMPVAAFPYPIWRSLKRSDNGQILLNFPEHLNARSQDLPEAYHDAGQWYWFRVQAFERERALMGPNTGSIVLSSLRVQDIDTEEDWAIAELKHERVFG